MVSQVTESGRGIVAAYFVVILALAVLAANAGFVGTAAAATNTPPTCSEVGYEGNGSGFYEVTNVSQLQCIENNGLGENYVLTSDIDASGTESWNQSSFEETRDIFSSDLPETIELEQAPIEGSSVSVVDDDDESIDVTIVSEENGVIEIDDGRSLYTNPLEISYETQDPVSVGFDPIGLPSDGEFSGTFDGSGHTISDLYIDRSKDDDVGLFSVVGSGGTIENVGLETVSVNGSSSVGGLVGNYIGEVRESYATGSVNSSSSVGGLVGFTWGEVSKSYATASAEGANNNVGGLVGTINGGGGTVSESYATSRVDGADRVGGLVGGNIAGTVSESYSTGSVDGTGSVGGLVGENLDTVEDSYWDGVEAGLDDGVGAGGGAVTELTTDEMQGRSAIDEMDGLDFDATWWMRTEPLDGYPRLRAHASGFDATIDATNGPVTEGGTLDVDVTVTNTDGTSDSQDVTLLVDGATADTSTGLTVAGDDTEQITLQWETKSDEAGTYDLEVTTAAAIATDTVSVEERYELSTSTGTRSTGLSESVVVDGDLSLSGPNENLDAARVTIQNVQDGDRLGVDTSGTGVTDDGYDANTGVLELSGSAAVSDYESVLRTVEFQNTEADADTDATDRTITFSLGSSVPSEDTGHYYEYVSDSGIRWDTARDDAKSRDYFGLTGYLVTVTSDDENGFVAKKLDGQGWTGATDAATETEWRWVTGPEGQEESGDGRYFFEQAGTSTGCSSEAGGDPVGDNYDNWASGEPNNCDGEDYAHFRSDATWNDYAVDNANIDGYVVEYGGRDDDPDVKLRDTRTVALADGTDPTADAGSERSVDEDAAVTFDGSASTDNVDVTAYDWDFDDGETATGEMTTHTFAEPGTYAVELTVEDGAGNADAVTAEITVADVTEPVADVGENRSVDTGASVAFDGSNSTDNDAIASYAWDFDDGETASGASPNHAFDDAGTYAVELTVEDDGGNTDADVVWISVTGRSGGGTSEDEEKAAGGDESAVVAGERTDDGGVAFDVWDDDGSGPITLDVRNGRRSERGVETDGDRGGDTATDGDDGTTGSGDDATREPRDVAVDRLSITPTGDGERSFEVTVREWGLDERPDIDGDDAGGDGGAVAAEEAVSTGDRRTAGRDAATTTGNRTDPRAFLEETGASAVGYVSVTHSNPDRDIDSVRFRFRVRTAYLNETGVGPGEVSLYRDESGGWRELPTEAVGRNATHHVFEAESPGLSLFTVGSTRPVIEVQAASIGSATATVGEPVDVDATVTNLGGIAGTHTVTLRADGDTVARQSVTLSEHGRESVPLSFAPSEAGEYHLMVDGEPAGRVTVVDEPAGEDDGDEVTDETDDGGPFPSWLLVAILGSLVLLGVRQYRRRDDGA